MAAVYIVAGIKSFICNRMWLAGSIMLRHCYTTSLQCWFIWWHLVKIIFGILLFAVILRVVLQPGALFFYWLLSTATLIIQMAIELLLMRRPYLWITISQVAGAVYFNKMGVCICIAFKTF